MHAAALDNLLRTIDDQLHETAASTGVTHLSGRVRRALKAVSREAFVLPGDVASAYENRPLPIGHGQTISQPFIVALMTELLALGDDARVLEVGTGCGYQAAVLAEVAAEVESVEVVPQLAAAAGERLATLGYTNVHVHQADGYAGWASGAPYDGILVTAAAPEVPPALLAQLKPGARLVIPVGEAWDSQMLEVHTRLADDEIERRGVLPVAFVPLVSG